MQKIVYFGVGGFEGKFFTCQRYGVMSPAACSKNFVAAPEAIRTGRLDGCVGCKVGQFHTNPAATAPPLAKTAFAYRQICVRCRRGGADDESRLIGRMRLVREHTTCVSCYNREREVIQGRNAKGAKPKKWKNLFHVQIGSVAAGRLTIEQFDHPVRDRLEAILTLMRRRAGPKVVAWTAPRAVVRMGAMA